MHKKTILVIILCFVIDFLIKEIVINSLNVFETIRIIPNFFSLTFIKNDGAAFNILSGNRIFLIIIALTSILLIYHFFIKNQKFSKLEIINYGVLFGGIFGNLFDRIIRGYIIDYLDFKIFNYHFPIFNFADICIVISTIIILIIYLKGAKNND